jgi:PIN domain nuclease of toxin-antitoxin system
MTYITDTHALVWLLEGDPQLSPLALQVFSDPDARIVIPTIVLAEIRFLYAHQRIAINLEQVFGYIAQASNALTYPLDELVIEHLPTALRIHDAIIVATGLVFRDVMGEPTCVLTRDARIIASGLIDTKW